MGSKRKADWTRENRVQRITRKTKRTLCLDVSIKEIGKLTLKITGLTMLVAWLFYDSLAGVICGVFVGYVIVKEYRENQKRKRQYELDQQFCVGLTFASGALEAGYSVEGAWRQTQREIEILYGKQAVFARWLQALNEAVGMNQPVEKIVQDWAQKTDSENIKNFSEIFCFARKSGGNMVAIMRRTADRIRQNFQVMEEVQMAIASRRLELMIMNIMPFGILAYLRIGSDGFLQPLYHNFFGVLVMTVCLGIYFVAWFLAKRFIRIGV